jgi:hypothetical protein
MRRLTGLYPRQESAFFDWDYYINIHIPLAKRCFENSVLRWGIDSGIHGEDSSEEAPYMVAAFITMTSASEFNEIKSGLQKLHQRLPMFWVSNIPAGYP